MTTHRIRATICAAVLIALSAGCSSAGFKPKGVGSSSGDAPASTVDKAAMRDYYTTNVQTLLNFGVPYDTAIDAWSNGGFTGDGPSTCKSSAAVEESLGDPPAVPDAALQARLTEVLAEGYAALQACGDTSSGGTANQVRTARSDLIAVLGAIQDAGN